MLPEEDTSPSPGPGSVQAGERWTLCLFSAWNIVQQMCLSPGILGRPRSLGEGHLPKATQSLVVELGLQLAPFSAHSA